MTRITTRITMNPLPTALLTMTTTFHTIREVADLPAESAITSTIHRMRSLCRSSCHDGRNKLAETT